MGFSSKSQLAKDTARRTGRLPHQVEARDGGELVARELDGTETVVGTWSKTWGKTQPRYDATA